MKKQFILPIVIITGLIAGALVYVLVVDSDSTEMSSDSNLSQAQTSQSTADAALATETSDDSTLAAQATDAETTEATTADETESADTQATAGSYVDYSEAGLANSTGDNLLFFHASWCPQCQKLEEDFKAQNLPDGLTVFKVDFDDYQDLRVKYGVTQQTTVVKVDSEGNLISKFAAYNDPTYSAVSAALL